MWYVERRRGSSAWSMGATNARIGPIVMLWDRACEAFFRVRLGGGWERDKADCRRARLVVQVSKGVLYRVGNVVAPGLRFIPGICVGTSRSRR